jgi:hypothetical protein
MKSKTDIAQRKPFYANNQNKIDEEKNQNSQIKLQEKIKGISRNLSELRNHFENLKNQIMEMKTKSFIEIGKVMKKLNRNSVSKK